MSPNKIATLGSLSSVNRQTRQNGWFIWELKFSRPLCPAGAPSAPIRLYRLLTTRLARVDRSLFIKVMWPTIDWPLSRSAA